MAKLIIGMTDLTTTHPNLAAEWDQAKNGDLTPQEVSHGSRKSVWWLCEKGHSWKAAVSTRSRGDGCPTCSGKRIEIGYNDLATTHPALATEWDQEKNGDLTPREVSHGSHKRVWWCCENGHSWKVAVLTRSSGYGCPVCAGKSIEIGYNDLTTTHPTLAAEWDQAKNGDLTPQEVSHGSGKSVWWQCENGHSWKAAVSSRSSGCGCPICAGKSIEIGYNDLATTHPILAAEWDQAKNGDLTPGEVSHGSGKSVWWQCENGHSWKAAVSTRSSGYGCPTCAGRSIEIGFNDLATTHPALAIEWDQEKNDDLTPQEVSHGSEKSVWWQCEKGHSWKATIKNRSKGNGCPICSGKRIEIGYNDLATTHPALAVEWDQAKNGDLTPQEVSHGSKKSIWWQCEKGHSWKATVSTRSSGPGCPTCAGKRIEIGYNDLVTTHPNLSAEWDQAKNGDLTPQEVSQGSGKSVWWQCEKGHSWKAAVSSRSRGYGCPSCAGKRIEIGYNDLATTHPDLAAEWDQEKNGDLTPQEVSHGSEKSVWWQCEKGHSWKAAVSYRSRGYGCPTCSGKRIEIGYNDLATTHPDLAAEWDQEKNGDLTPQEVSYGSNKIVWWCSEDGCRWKANIKNRVNGSGCPLCLKFQKSTK
ncbi:zinc-ribbon domain-containing protein [Acetobacterium sp.]|uniref:zinc-ribbon domain-containing protein n=1 Tax=Acetobacterium sp. TaxID=1872094 RepID=UPI002F405B37